MKGKIKAVSEKNKSVLINYENEGEIYEEWFKLGPRVSLDYVKKGECEFKGDLNQKYITFIKSTEIPEQKVKFETADKTEEEIRRMSALKASSLVYQASGDEENFKRLTNEIVKFISSGTW